MPRDEVLTLKNVFKLHNLKVWCDQFEKTLRILGKILQRNSPQIIKHEVHFFNTYTGFKKQLFNFVLTYTKENYAIDCQKMRSAKVPLLRVLSLVAPQSFKWLKQWENEKD